MRVLHFIVDGEKIYQDPSCDFGGLFPGRNYDVQAEFTFSNDWDNKAKVAAFWSIRGAEYDPQVLQDNTCMIPPEALDRAAFKIQVLGKKGNASTSTNKLVILQTGARR